MDIQGQFRSRCLTFLFVSYLRVALCDQEGYILTREQVHIVLCLGRIMEEYFIQDEHAVIILPENDIYVKECPTKTLYPRSNFINAVGYLLKRTYKVQRQLQIIRVFTDTLSKNVEDDGHHHYYILFMPSCEDKEEAKDEMENLVFDIISDEGYFNSNARFIVVVDRGEMSPSELTSTIMEYLFKGYDVLDVLVMVTNYQANEFCGTELVNTDMAEGTIGFYTMFLLSPEKKPVLLDEWIMEGSGRFLKGSNLFPGKIPHKLNTKPLAVTTFHTPPFMLLTGEYKNEKNKTMYMMEGPEIYLLNVICDHLNLTFSYVDPNITGGDYVFKLMLMLVRVGLNQADIAIGSLPLHEKTIGYMDYTQPYLTVGETWYVPCPRLVPRLEKISQIFHLSVWVMFAAVIILTGVVIWCIAKLNVKFEFNLYSKIQLCFLAIWAVILGVSVPDLPRTTKLRGLFLCFIWYAFAMNTLFQTYFTSYLVDPGYFDQIRTFDELLSSGLKYGYLKDAHKYYFSDDTDWRKKEVYEHGEDCSDYKKCLLRVINEGDYGTLRSEIYAEHFVKTTMPEQVNPLCTIDSRFVTYFISMYVKRSSFLLTPIKHILSRIMESGIIEKKRKDFEEAWRYQSVPETENKNQNPPSDGYFVFTLEHLLIAFQSLVVGCIFSFIVFISEVISGLANKHVLK